MAVRINGLDIKLGVITDDHMAGGTYTNILIPAENVIGGGGSTGDANWILSGSNIYNGNTGNVGINNATPAYKLDVAGTFRTAGNALVTTNSTVANTILSIENTGNKNAEIELKSSFSSHPWSIVNSGGQLAITNSYNTSALILEWNWGVAVDKVPFKLNQLTGYTGCSAELYTTGAGATLAGYMKLNKGSTGDTTGAYITGDSTLNSYILGNVGIGKTGPVNKLDVVGSVNADNYKISGVTLLASHGATAANLFIGAETAASYVSGPYITHVGMQAGASGTTGYSNTNIGAFAGRFNTTGVSNTNIGVSTSRNRVTGDHNVAVGSLAGQNSVSGSENTFVGALSGFGTSGSDCQYTTAIGCAAGYRLAAGSDYNTLLGYQAGGFITTGSYNIVIGGNQDVSGATASYELNIGGAIKGNLQTLTVVLPGLPACDFANDGAAAAGGILVGGLYHTSGAVKVRLA